MFYLSRMLGADLILFLVFSFISILLIIITKCKIVVFDFKFLNLRFAYFVRVGRFYIIFFTIIETYKNR